MFISLGFKVEETPFVFDVVRGASLSGVDFPDPSVPRTMVLGKKSDAMRTLWFRNDDDDDIGRCWGT